MRARSLRVLHLAHAVHGWEAGGVGRYVTALSAAQSALGASVSALEAGDIAPERRGFRASYHRPDVAAWVAQRVGAEQIDVVHVHHFHRLGLELVGAAQQAGAKVVVTLHDHALICARGQLVHVGGGRCSGPTPARCSVCVKPYGLPPPLGVLASGRRLAAVRALRPDLWLTVAPHLSARLGVSATLTELPLLEPAPPPKHRAPGPTRFLFVGALLPTKGVDRALRAFEGQAASLTVAGPTPAWARPWAATLPRPKGVSWLPPQPSGPLYDAHDVLLFPSTWDEGSPLVLREAAARGMRILASDVPGARHALAGYEAVFLPQHDGAWRAAISSVPSARLPPLAVGDLRTHAEHLLAVYDGLDPRR